MHIKQQWKIIAGVSIVGLLLLISGIIASHYRLQRSKTQPSPVIDEKLTRLREEEGGESAYRLLKKIVFLDEGLQPVTLLEDIALVDAQEEQREDILLLPTLLEKHGFLRYTESKEFISLNPMHAAEMREYHANFREALPAIIAALGTKNHLISYDEGATSSVVLDNQLSLLAHVKNDHQLSTSEGLKLLVYLIYTSRWFSPPAEMLNYAEKAEEIANALYPEDHQEKIDMLIGVGFAMARHKTPQEAYHYYQAALDMLQRLYPDPSPRDIAVNKQAVTILERMSNILHELGKTKEATNKLKQAMKIKEIAQIMQSLSAYSDFWAYVWYNWFIFKKKGILLGMLVRKYAALYMVIACGYLLLHRRSPQFQHVSTLQFIVRMILSRLLDAYKKILRLFNATEIVRKAYSWVWTLLAFLPYYLFDKIFAWHFEPSSKAPLHFAWVKLWIFLGVFFMLFLLYNLYPWQYHYREKYGKKLTIAKSLLITYVEICCALLVSACLTVVFCTLLLALAILRSKRANKWTSLNEKITLPAILEPDDGTDDHNCCVCLERNKQRWSPCLQCNGLLCFSCFAKIKCTLASNVSCPSCRANIWRDIRDSKDTSWRDSYTYKAKKQETLTAAQSWQHLRLLLDSFFFELGEEAPQPAMAQMVGGAIGNAFIGQGLQPRMQQFAQQADQIAAQQQARHQVGVTNILLLQAMKGFFVGFVPIIALVSCVSPRTLAYLINILAAQC